MSLLKEGEKIWVGEDYASVTWRAEDIKKLKPNWSMPKCEEWLEYNEEDIKDRMIEKGWDIIEGNLTLENKEDDDEKV